MTLSVHCPCGRKLKLKDELAGKRVRCPSCKQILAVPELESLEDVPFATAEVLDDDNDNDDRPVPKKKRRKVKLKRKSNRLLIVGLSAAGVFMACCTFGIVALLIYCETVKGTGTFFCGNGLQGSSHKRCPSPLRVSSHGGGVS
jgi:hypothetical protein